MILESNKFFVNAGTRLFQICSRDLEPVQVKIADILTETERGEGDLDQSVQVYNIIRIMNIQ